MTSTTTPRPSLVPRPLRILAAMIAGFVALVALPGAAFAQSEPVRPGSGSVPAVTSGLTPASTADSASGWGLTTIVGIALLAALAVGLAVVAQRVTRHRRDARPTALPA